MNNEIERLKKGLSFDKLYDNTTNHDLNNSELFIPWTCTFNDIEKISLGISKYEFGIDYDLGKRTIFSCLTFSWYSRAGLNKEEIFGEKGIETQLGWGETGYDVFIKT